MRERRIPCKIGVRTQKSKDQADVSQMQWVGVRERASTHLSSPQGVGEGAAPLGQGWLSEMEMAVLQKAECVSSPLLLPLPF